MKHILFNTEMVLAILEGRKTCTRRVVKIPHCGFFEHEPPRVVPPYQTGDILYVRETWNKVKLASESDWHYEYRASCENPAYFSNGFMAEWRPSIHMPKEAARLFLRVTDVWVERLQDITDEQAEAEGVRGFLLGMGESGYAVKADSDTFYDGPIGAFANLWDSTVKKTDRDTYGWDANPWVWVIKFERCEKPEEE